MNIENLSAEQICQGISILGNLIDLQSKDREKIRSALGTLAAITRLGCRKDSLYALAGYYVLEVHSLEEIEFFFNAIQPFAPADLGYMMLRDLSQKKEACRHKTLMDDLSKDIGRISRDASPGTREKFIELVESAEWGDKLKDKFLSRIY